MNEFALENNPTNAEEIRSITVTPAQMIEADTRANIDMQIETAKKYKRDLPLVLRDITYLATQDMETAESCFYAIKRDGKTIRGASIRLAEIICNCYGNIRAWARVVAKDGKTVTAQGFCWDLEKNTAYGIEVERRITDKNGRLFSDDMQVVTANAARSIALRNAILKVIPLAITNVAQKKIKAVIEGEASDFVTYRSAAIKYFINAHSVTEKQILDLFGRKSLTELTREDVFDLKGIDTAIKDGDSTVEQTFAVATRSNAIGRAANRFSDAPIVTQANTIEPTFTMELESDGKEDVHEKANTIVSVKESIEKKDDEVLSKEGLTAASFGASFDAMSPQTVTVTFEQSKENVPSVEQLPIDTQTEQPSATFETQPKIEAIQPTQETTQVSKATQEPQKETTKATKSKTKSEKVAAKKGGDVNSGMILEGHSSPNLTDGVSSSTAYSTVTSKDNVGVGIKLNALTAAQSTSFEVEGKTIEATFETTPQSPSTESKGDAVPFTNIADDKQVTMFPTQG